MSLELSKGTQKFVLKFPLETGADIEMLEDVIQNSESARNKYKQLLQQCIRENPRKPSLALLKLFTDKSLDDYNYTGHCNYTRSKKNAMKDYMIFTDCIDDAWNNILPPGARMRAIRGAIALCGNRKRMLRMREKQRKHCNTDRF
ncbi:uncharacterized protein LOC131286109 [Anopheles ziemanni]|uniref:uncharacterized protein LOC131272581 n=1 Tax=Anopheles coustani TaxID=139045 RepID=UPI00265AB7EA|nr:uncharacterized protein LOC131272581 [Anopheles coustani]XP_058170980.1 uncharacterized protein LOC131286109 [Anopheles ziemanni]